MSGDKSDGKPDKATDKEQLDIFWLSGETRLTDIIALIKDKKYDV